MDSPFLGLGRIARVCRECHPPAVNWTLTAGIARGEHTAVTPSFQRHLRARNRHLAARVPRPDAHRLPPSGDRASQIRRALQLAPTPPLSRRSCAIRTGLDSRARHGPRPCQTTNNRSSEWPDPRIPAGRLSWAVGVLGTHTLCKRAVNPRPGVFPAQRARRDSNPQPSDP